MRKLFFFYLQFIPKVLALFPAVSPTVGKKSLPKREGASARAGRASFGSDVLAGLGVPAAKEDGDHSQAAASSAAGPPEPRQERAVSDETPARHEWHWQAGRWLCTACLTTSRLPVPPRGDKCAGMASNLAKLLSGPKKHKLHLATLADGKGVVVACSRCELHKKPCKATGGQAAFASSGARTAYERITTGRHPTHAKGETKVLDPWMSLEALRRASQPQRELEA